MNPLQIVSVLAAVVACSGSFVHPILRHHVALPHNLPYDPIGIQKVPVVPVGHAPTIAVSHSTAPLTVSHHAVAPLANAHHAVAPLAIAHHGVAPLANAHHAVAPLAVRHHVPGVTVAHAVSPVAHVKSHHHVEHVTPVKTQYHSQDELGQYSFGYKNGNSARDESRDAYGNVRGSYSYVDSYGKLQTQHYIADDYGFRVTGTNLPVQVSDGHGYRHKRSYATFPASTGPLTTVSHVVPAVHKVAHVHKVAPVVHNAAHVHQVAPVVHSPLYHGAYHTPARGFSYNFHTLPSYTDHGRYSHPIINHGGLY